MVKLTILFVMIIICSFIMSIFLTFTIYKINGAQFYQNSSVENSRIFVLLSFVLSWMSFALLIIILVLAMMFRSFLTEEKCDHEIEEQNRKILFFMFIFEACISFISVVLSIIGLSFLLSAGTNNTIIGDIWVYSLIATIFGVILFVLLLVIFFMYRSSANAKCEYSPSTSTNHQLNNLKTD